MLIVTPSLTTVWLGIWGVGGCKVTNLVTSVLLFTLQYFHILISRKSIAKKHWSQLHSSWKQTGHTYVSERPYAVKKYSRNESILHSYLKKKWPTLYTLFGQVLPRSFYPISYHHLGIVMSNHQYHQVYHLAIFITMYQMSMRFR